MKYCLLFAAALALPTSAAYLSPSAYETSLSRSHYFTWIHNTNEGPATDQTQANLAFFQWMKDEHERRKQEIKPAVWLTARELPF